MKKFIAVVLVAILMFSLTSCASIEKMTEVGQKKYVLSRDKNNLEKVKARLESEIETLEKDNANLVSAITKLDGEIKEIDKDKSLAKSELATIKNKYEKATDKGFGITINELFTQLEYLVTETNAYYEMSFNYTPLYSVNSDGDTTVEYVVATDKKNNSVLSHVIVLAEDNIHVKKATIVIDKKIADKELSLVCGIHVSLVATALFLAMDSPFEFDSEDKELEKNITAMMYQNISNDGRIEFNIVQKEDYAIFEFEPSKKADEKKKY